MINKPVFGRVVLATARRSATDALESDSRSARGRAPQFGALLSRWNAAGSVQRRTMEQ